jgi:hypothetical protein
LEEHLTDFRIVDVRTQEELENSPMGKIPGCDEIIPLDKVESDFIFIFIFHFY